MNAISLEAAAVTRFEESSTGTGRRVALPADGVDLPAELVVPPGARGLVLAVTPGWGGESSRVVSLGHALVARRVATLSLPLLTADEALEDSHTGYWSFELDLLTHRLLQATHWCMEQPETRELGIGYLATGTFAAAALRAASQLGYAVQGIVARSGRPDFAAGALAHVTAPTLFIVGGHDEALRELNQRAFEHLVCRKQLTVISGAGRAFDEPGTLERVGELAAAWFATHLKAIRRR